MLKEVSSFSVFLVTIPCGTTHLSHVLKKYDPLYQQVRPLWCIVSIQAHCHLLFSIRSRRVFGVSAS